MQPRLTPRRTPGWPLAATLGAHLLLAWWWLHATGVRTLAVSGPAPRAFVVVPVLPRSPMIVRAPVGQASPAPRQARGARMRPAPAAQPIAAPDAPRAAVAPANAPAQPAAPDEPAVPAGANAPAAAGGDGRDDIPDDTAGRARRAAGAADRSLRQGAPAPLDPPDTPWNRFARALDEAHNDTSRTVVSDSYTAPDGTVVYRFRQGGRIYCRTGGQVRPRPGGAVGGGAELFDRPGGGGAAGIVECPRSAEFRRD